MAKVVFNERTIRLRDYQIPDQETTMGLYFEEFTVGQKIVTEKRIITEADIMEFARISGDNNRIHTDPEFSKTTPFGKQVAHGLLGLVHCFGSCLANRFDGWHGHRLP